MLKKSKGNILIVSKPNFFDNLTNFENIRYNIIMKYANNYNNSGVFINIIYPIINNNQYIINENNIINILNLNTNYTSGTQYIIKYQ